MNKRTFRNIGVIVLLVLWGLFCALVVPKLQAKQRGEITLEGETVYSAVYLSQSESIEVTELSPTESERVSFSDTETAWVTNPGEPAISETYRVYYDIKLTKAEQDIIYDSCEEFHIEPTIVFAMAYVESSYRADIIGDDGRSYGMFQIQPKYWQGLFDELGCTDWFSIKDNSRVCCAILEKFFIKYEDPELVLNKYNTGTAQYNYKYANKVFRVMNELKILEEEE